MLRRKRGRWQGNSTALLFRLGDVPTIIRLCAINTSRNGAWIYARNDAVHAPFV